MFPFNRKTNQDQPQVLNPALSQHWQVLEIDFSIY